MLDLPPASRHNAGPIKTPLTPSVPCCRDVFEGGLKLIPMMPRAANLSDTPDSYGNFHQSFLILTATEYFLVNRQNIKKKYAKKIIQKYR